MVWSMFAVGGPFGDVASNQAILLAALAVIVGATAFMVVRRSATRGIVLVRIDSPDARGRGASRADGRSLRRSDAPDAPGRPQPRAPCGTDRF